MDLRRDETRWISVEMKPTLALEHVRELDGSL